MTVYIHAGLPKTGSSAIQNACFNGRDKLAATGLGYWSIEANHSWPLALMLNAAKAAPGLHDVETVYRARFGESSVIREHLLAEMKGDFLISAENLGRLEPEALSQLASLCRNPLCLVYVREPRSWFTSAIQQKVKSGLGLDAAVDGYLSDRSFRQRIEHLQAAFDTTVRLYSSENLLADFVEAVGRPGLVLEAERDNDGVSAPAFWLLEAAHRNGGVGHTGWLRNMVRDIGGPRVQLPKSVMDRLLAAFAADIEWASGLVGVDLMSLEGPEAGVDGRLDNDIALLLNLMAREICDRKRIDALERGKALSAKGESSLAMKAFAQAEAFSGTIEQRQSVKALLSRLAASEPVPKNWHRLKPRAGG